jgi:hypothetical protein
MPNESLEVWGSHKQLCRDPNQVEEKRRLGTSANDPSRRNEEAESLAVDAANHFSRWALSESYQAIKLDTFNHIYYYSRSSAYHQSKN